MFSIASFFYYFLLFGTENRRKNHLAKIFYYYIMIRDADYHVSIKLYVSIYLRKSIKSNKNRLLFQILFRMPIKNEIFINVVVVAC